MFLTTHAAAGLFLSTMMPNPFAAGAAGIISHFILDMIPHEQSDDLIIEYPRYRRPDAATMKRKTRVGVADLVGAALIYLTAWLLIQEQPDGWGRFLILSAGIGGSVLPDFILILTFYSDNRFLRLYFKLNNTIHFIISRVSVKRIVSASYQLLLIILFVCLADYML